jgi:hypothetical protein
MLRGEELQTAADVSHAPARLVLNRPYARFFERVKGRPSVSACAVALILWT